MADCLRSLKIDDQLKIGRLLDRKVGGVVSTEYLDGELRALTPDLRETRPVSQETARLRRFSRGFLTSKIRRLDQSNPSGGVVTSRTLD